MCYCVRDALSVAVRVDLQICQYPLLLTAVMFNFCADDLAVDLAKCKRSRDSNGSVRYSVLESLTVTDISISQGANFDVAALLLEPEAIHQGVQKTLSLPRQYHAK